MKHRSWLHGRPYLASAIVLGALVALCLPHDWQPVTRALTGFNVMAWSYVLAMGWQFARADDSKVRELAAHQDESALAILTLLCVASATSIVAIVLELGEVNKLPLDARALRYAFTAATVFGAWFLVGVLFCIHYAHIWYLCPHHDRPFRFPDQDLKPNYWDFLYLAFTIAVAVQTSDVTITSRTMRKLVLVQSVLTFFFNIVILGLSVNIGASMING